MIIPDDKMAEGISLCQNNVDRFMFDAYILDQQGSYGHSLAFAIFALEEYAKKLVLIASAISPDKSGNKLKDAFERHKFKLKVVISEILRVLPNKPNVSQFEEAVNVLTDTISELRVTGLYVGYDDAIGWINPNGANLKGGAQHQIKYLMILMKEIEPRLGAIYKSLGGGDN